MFAQLRETVNLEKTTTRSVEGAIEETKQYVNNVYASIVAVSFSMNVGISSEPGTGTFPKMLYQAYDVVLRKRNVDGLSKIIWGSKELIPITAPQQINNNYIMIKTITRTKHDN